MRCGGMRRTCSTDLWQNTDTTLTYKVEVSYMEIYNEKVCCWPCT